MDRSGLRAGHGRAWMIMSAAAVSLLASQARANIFEGLIAKDVQYQQTGPDTVTPIAGGVDAIFVALAANATAPFGGGPSTMDSIVLTYPGSGSPLALSTSGQFYLSPMMTPAALDAAFPAGTYTFTGTNTATSESRSLNVAYVPDALPSAHPKLTADSYNALQGVDAALGATLSFDALTPDPRSVSSDIQVNLLDLTLNKPVTLSSGPFTFLPSSATDFVLPGGLLTAGHSYALGVVYQDETSNQIQLPSWDIPIAAYSVATIVDFTAGAPVLGASPTDPFLPTSSTGGTMTFEDPSSGSWYDPPMTHGFDFSLSSGDFTEVGAPPVTAGFGPLDVIVDGKVVDVLNPGTSYLFAPGVTEFRLKDISPGVNPSDPTAFPVYLAFSGAPRTLTMGAVPEPSSWALTLLGVTGCGALLRRRSRQAA
jgi:hypothetical protein